MNSTRPSSRQQRREYLALVCIFLAHVLVTTVVYLVLSRPAFIRIASGGAFGPDAIDVLQETRALSQLLSSGSFLAWLLAPSALYVKIYSVSYLLFAPLAGHTILAVEPVNATYYCAILTLTYVIGRSAFTSASGKYSVVALALWPSLAFHSTQPLKDPLFIVMMLLLVFTVLRILNQQDKIRDGLINGLLGCFALLIIAATRPSIWSVVEAVCLVTAAIVLVNSIRHRRWEMGRGMAAAMLLIVAVFLPHYLTDARSNQRSVLHQGLVSAIQSTRSAVATESEGAGSTLPDKRRVSTLLEIGRTVPRALLVGAFAPFPRMWVQYGFYVGIAGRLMAGTEMAAFYLLYCLAAVGAIANRGSPSTWFLVVVVLIGMISLGLVELNVGTLFRLRYVFHILVIVLAAAGFRYLQARHRANQ